ncbi:MAG: hypothetical protein QNL12_01645, partial [Acidimicrobiia bacterium]|nr:hypothetical protein [Acidimicrobiia bacterium]MDX2465989.1 hypothetical protein [Acidimicrobiia bacterium]
MGHLVPDPFSSRESSAGSANFYAPLFGERDREYAIGLDLYLFVPDSETRPGASERQPKLELLP